MNRKKPSTLKLQPYATQLRRQLLAGRPFERLMELHEHHQQVLRELRPMVKHRRLHPADGFAWKFLNQVEILRPDFKTDRARTRPRGQGVFQNFTQRVLQVQQRHFREMSGVPKVRWLSRFTTRKLAHYNATEDEVAFSLIFDQPQAPTELLDYLAFHELLHRQIGVKREGGRLKAHTPAFKQAERAYPGFHHMDQQIREYITAHQQVGF